MWVLNISQYIRDPQSLHVSKVPFDDGKLENPYVFVKT